jgi:hypothetical protein
MLSFGWMGFVVTAVLMALARVAPREGAAGYLPGQISVGA